MEIHDLLTFFLWKNADSAVGRRMKGQTVRLKGRMQTNGRRKNADSAVGRRMKGQTVRLKGQTVRPDCKGCIWALGIDLDP